LNNTIYLVDAYAHIYRGFYAVRSLTTSEGKPSNAIYAMSRFLVQLEKEFSPDFGAFVFDVGAPKKRLELAPDYKANRSPMPDDLRAQLKPIRELIKAAGWKVIEVDGYEADDVLATIAKKFDNREVKIISNDKDIAQVVNEKVNMYITIPGKKGFVLRDTENVISKFDVRPEQIVDYLAMIGDSADNIPGVAGVGPKTAAALMKQFGSIDNMLENVEEIKKEKLREKIKNSKELLKLNIELIRLDTDIESGLYKNVEQLEMDLPDLNKLENLSKIYQLRYLIKDYSEIQQSKLSPNLFDL
jgi:DNA polymerase I